uniref:Uncharacterized protein n=1 Tax=Arundo donax TaxID=35708 RepID=A0A0A9CKB5_ARUDO
MTQQILLLANCYIERFPWFVSKVLMDRTEEMLIYLIVNSVFLLSVPCVLCFMNSDSFNSSVHIACMHDLYHIP